jgi:menaquinone-dependent protoporphyrinogen IX oxidase
MSEKNKIAVVYQSKSGFTKSYAQWLAEELHCDLLEGKKIKVSDLQGYDTIIYGGGLYAINVGGVKLITKNYELLKDKNIIVFAVGSSPVREESTQKIRKENIPAEQFDKIKFFYLRGGFDYSKLSPINKILMSMLKLKLKGIKNPDADQRGLLAAYDHPQNFTNKKYLKPIIECVG